MARPPLKRRKLSDSEQDTPWAEYRAVGGYRSHEYAHAMKPLEDSHHAVGGIEGHRVLLPRQGTAVTPPATTSTPTDLNISPELALSLSVSLSLSLPDVPGIATGLPASAISGILSDVSGVLAPTTPIETASVSSTSLPNDTTNTLSTSLGNATIPIDTTGVTSTSGDLTTSSLVPSSTSSGFITSSFPRNSTSRATISTESSISSTQTSSSSESSVSSVLSSSTTDSAILFVASFSGDLTTISPSGDAYMTTVDDNTFTISAAATTFSLSSSTGRQTFVSTATDNGAGIAGQNTPSAYPTSTAPASTSNSNDSPPPAGAIAGGVVGGAAGLAVVVLIAMLAVRWYRRQGMARHQALPQGPVHSPDPDVPSSGGAGMAERAGLMPLAAAVPALFRNQSRSAQSRDNAERGFTRVSGRKVPSAFGGGLTIQPAPNTSAYDEEDLDRNNNHYNRGSSGFYSADGTNLSPSSLTGSLPLRSNSVERMTMSPGPQRTPTLVSGGPYNMSPGSAGPSSPPANLTRSDAPFLDPSRNSRFSEGL